MQWKRSIGAAFALLAAAALALAQDVVRYVRTDETPAEATGLIEEFDASGVTLRLASGSRLTVPLPRIREVRPRRIAAHQEARDALDHRDFLTAQGRLQAARQAETRPWMQREIEAEWIETLAALGRRDGTTATAGNRWLELIAKKSPSRHFAAIPLAWGAERPTAALQRAANVWLNDEATSAQLLGASWLLFSSDQAAAERTLARLTADRDSRIALLAETQRWRRRFLTTDAGQLDGWARIVERLPPSLRAGPRLLLGKAYGGKQQHEQAALTLMKIPILHPRQWALVPEALFLAAEQLELAGDGAAAARLYREVERGYRDTRWAALAAEALKNP